MRKIIELFNYTRNLNSLYWNNSALFLVFFISLFLVLFMEKSKKKKDTIFWYSIITYAIICSPFSIIIGNKLWGDNYAYFCRLFSIIPIFLTIAYACSIYCIRFTSIKKMLFTVSCIVVIILSGKSIYSEGWHNRAANLMKLPSDIPDICNQITSNTRNPTIMVSNDLICYIRQYDASIHTITRRNDNSSLAIETNKNTDLDVDYIMETCCEEGADFVIVKNNDNIYSSFLSKGYTPFYTGKNSLVYKCAGYPSKDIEYNSLNQIASISYFDENDIPTFCKLGYSKIKYEYNRNNQVILETYYDTNDNPILLDTMISGKKYDYDKQNRVSQVYFINSNLNLTSNIENIVSIKYKYDTNNNIIKETYFDKSGNITLNDSGYAAVKRKYNSDNLLLEEQFLDVNGNPQELYGLYSGKIYTYDTNDFLASQTYIDSEGNPTLTPSGFSSIRYERDSDGNVIHKLYLDLNGSIVQEE